MHLGTNYVLRFFLLLAVFYLLPEQLKRKRVMSPKSEVCDDLLNYSACIRGDGELQSDGSAEEDMGTVTVSICVCLCVCTAYQRRSSCTLYGCQQTVGLCNPGNRQLL